MISMHHEARTPSSPKGAKFDGARALLAFRSCFERFGHGCDFRTEGRRKLPGMREANSTREALRLFAVPISLWAKANRLKLRWFS